MLSLWAVGLFVVIAAILNLNLGGHVAAPIGLSYVALLLWSVSSLNLSLFDRRMSSNHGSSAAPSGFGLPIALPTNHFSTVWDESGLV
jgi:hypothetical protein